MGFVLPLVSGVQGLEDAVDSICCSYCLALLAPQLHVLGAALPQNQLSEGKPPGDSSAILGIGVRNESKKAIEVGILEFELMLAQWQGSKWLDYPENE